MTIVQLNADVKTLQYTAGWEKLRPSLWREPASEYHPRLWRYAEGRALLARAGDLLSTDQADRRNLLMFDRADPNQYATTRTMVGAYQMLRGGEHARAHRHSPNALRLILEGGGGVATVVNGVELPMRPGSVLLTPGMDWHSHFSAPGEPDAYWIDILDVPLVQQLEPMFFENYPQTYQESRERPDHHPYLSTSDDIVELLAASMADAHGLVSADLSHPAIATLSIRVTRAAAGASWRFQEASNTLIAVMAGSGRVRADDLHAPFGFGDLLSLPMWCAAELELAAGTELLCVSDRPTMQALGFYRRTEAPR